LLLIKKFFLGFLKYFILPIFLVYISLTGCITTKRYKLPKQSEIISKKEKENIFEILSSQEVKRKDIAFVLIYYLRDFLPFFEPVSKGRPVNDNISDITGLKEEEYIKKAVNMGWMRIMPDGKFYPYDKVKRFQFAIILYRVFGSLVFLQNSGQENVDIKDVHPSDYIYNPVFFVVSHKLLPLVNGYFYRNKTVTGYEVCLALSKLRKMLKK